MTYEVDVETDHAGAKYIEICSPQIDVDIQDLYDVIREAEATPEGIVHNKIASASGKESLWGGAKVAITLQFSEEWQLHFYSGNYTATITGGNLVGGPGNDPVAYTAGVQTLLIQSAHATIVDSNEALEEIRSDMQRLLGLSFENTYRHSIIYDGDGRVSSEILDKYNSKANAQAHDGVTGFQYRYEIAYTYDANGQLFDLSCVRSA